jgi:hypothetical protein
MTRKPANRSSRTASRASGDDLARTATALWCRRIFSSRLWRDCALDLYDLCGWRRRFAARARRQPRGTGQARDRAFDLIERHEARLRIGPTFGRARFGTALFGTALFGTALFWAALFWAALLTVPVAASRLFAILFSGLVTILIPALVPRLITAAVALIVAGLIAISVPILLAVLLVIILGAHTIGAIAPIDRAAVVCAVVTRVVAGLGAARIDVILVVIVGVLVTVIVGGVEAGAVFLVIIAGAAHRLALTVPIIAKQAIIMFCILQIIFCRHPITGLLRITREATVFFEELAGVAALAIVQPVAVIVSARHLLGTRTVAAAAPPVLIVPDQLRVPMMDGVSRDAGGCSTLGYACLNCRSAPGWV